MSEPDWKHILLAYIRHVAAAEGTTFIGWMGVDQLSAQDLTALRQVETEALGSNDAAGR